MSRALSVTEPHPSVPKTGGYVYGGRGGAGNYKRYKAEEITPGPSATGPASRINLAKGFLKRQQQPTFYGRGGAGNSFRSVDSEERVFQFDEEMLRKREVQAPVYHIGRGGAANWVDESRRVEGGPGRVERVGSTASAVSSSSEGSVGAGGNGSERKRSQDVNPFSKLARRFS